MTSAPKQLDVLLIEDDEDDYVITRALLKKAQTVECTLDWASTYQKGRDAVLTDTYDVCLVDYRLGQGSGLDLLEEINAHGGVQAPIILLTGQGDLEVDLSAMAAGAADYLSKDEIDAPLLERSLRYAVERKQAEQRIREQAQLLDKARDAILAYDLDGEIVYWNKGAERLTGWAADDILGERAHECLYDPDQQDKLKQCHETMMEDGEWTGELRMRTADGDERVVESRWTLVRDTMGDPKQVLVINTDITERKQLETQFLRSQRMESIGRLVGGIAHDLGNLLMPITLGVKVLRRRLNTSDEKIERTLSMIQQSSARGADMVEQVLAFARGVEGERVALDPGAIVEETESITDETFPETITVETRVPDDLRPVVGDATQLQQVLMNLCVNARDAMPEGGTLTIAVQNVTYTEADAQRTIDAEPGPYVQVRVSDTGTGMPDEVADKIFEPFFSTKEEGEGTGLGLSTAYSIVKSHDGFIDVDSEEGVGTTFRVHLPAADAAEADDAPAEAPPAAHTRPDGEHVLVVDDEAFIRETAKQTLEDEGYEVTTVADAREALQWVAEQDGQVDAVVTDLRMPDMSGLDFIRTLHARHPRLSIVAISGLADGRTEEALQAGAHAFLAKPITADKLQGAVREAVHANENLVQERRE
ncbi:MAG: response regulator [Salinibacter sp.]